MEKTGLDLFEVPLKDFNGYLYTVIKKAFYRWYYKERKGEKYLYFSTDQLESNLDSPEEAVFAQDLYEILLKKIQKSESKNNNTNEGRLAEVFKLRAFGYTQTDIADELNIDKQLSHYYNKKINLVLTNPFNGSRLKITKQISLNTWEKKIDQDDYEMDDENEFYRVYRHKESKDGLLVKLPSTKTNPYISNENS